MLIYLLSAVILIIIAINQFLGYKLYEVPKNQEYFNNVNEINLVKERNISANPKYIVKISIFTGIMIGLYAAYASVYDVSGLFVLGMVLVFLGLYFIELTRKITLKEGTLTLSKFLGKTYEIDARKISGMYIYSYNKRFLNKHAYTTKLVIVDDSKKIIRFTLSSLDNRSVLNMMKESFGINNYKMFISKREKMKNISE